MRLGDVLNEMMDSPTPKVAVKKDKRAGVAPIHITIIRPTETEALFVQLYNGSTYSHLSSQDILSTDWEWA